MGSVGAVQCPHACKGYQEDSWMNCIIWLTVKSTDRSWSSFEGWDWFFLAEGVRRRRAQLCQAWEHQGPTWMCPKKCILSYVRHSYLYQLTPFWPFVKESSEFCEFLFFPLMISSWVFRVCLSLSRKGETSLGGKTTHSVCVM
jgi:hypothetical protein